MKSFFISIIFVLFGFLSFSQTQFVFAPSEFGNFKVSTQAQCGLGSVYCMVVRSGTPNAYGNYVYQVYFSSNSYLPNCQAARTYVPDIVISVFDGKTWVMPYNFFSFWVTVGPTALAYTLFHPNPYLQVKVSTGPIQPTIY